jgi:uncharacterized membrane protein YraQ (UPF0718 family)
MIFLEFFWEMLKISGVWLMFSFLICGVLHAFLRPEALQQSLGNKKVFSLVKSTVSGMLLPICSCGVVPLALGLYYSGAYLGPTLAFLVATPVINPAALIMSYALLGREIATIYLICGFILPMITGWTANCLGGNEIVSPAALKQGESRVRVQTDTPRLLDRLKSGLIWSFQDLAVQTCRFILLGTAFAAILFAIMPTSFIQDYLSEPKFISLLGAALLGAVMYVCALGHIPFIAALVAAGTAPGIAITFLLSGVATNLPEIISIWKLIGKRAVVIYTSSVVLFGLAAGYATNVLLGGSFVPQFDMSKAQAGIDIVNKISFSFPSWLETLCAACVAAIGIYSWFLYLKSKYALKRAGAVVLLAALLSAGGRAEAESAGALFEIFRGRHPDKEVILTLLGDCNDDGILDLVVVYKEDDTKNHQVTIYSRGAELHLTQPIPAPYENCRLQWKNVDERPPCELLVSGRRGIKFGYAVLRFVDGEWVNIFGNSMQECC